jgi:16S rRNA (adenine1518-N6/adenine1519-N6)-dimethyltransferase
LSGSIEAWDKNLCSPAVVRELLEKYHLAPKKGFGQNFLINSRIPQEIAEASVPDEAWNGVCAQPLYALEIGPGLGAMTRHLSALYDRVAAVEIDRGLIPLLDETLADCTNVQVINEDFMKLDVPAFLKQQFGGGAVHVCANLPYYITTPILMKLLEAQKPSQQPQIQSVTILVQTEVADRLCAPAGSAAYGAITAAVCLAGTAKKLFSVSAGNFLPQPKVASSVVQVRLYQNGIRDAIDELPADDAALDVLIEKTKELISLGFGQRRKTLVNALSSVYTRESVTAALENLNLRADIRGEKLSAEQFVALARRLT